MHLLLWQEYGTRIAYDGELSQPACATKKRMTTIFDKICVQDGSTEGAKESKIVPDGVPFALRRFYQ